MTSRLRVIVLLLPLGCADLERGPAPVEPEAGAQDDGGAGDGASGDGGALSFETSVRPLLQACARCHAPGEQAADTQLVFMPGGTAAADYAAVSRFVDTSAPSGSRLLTKMRGQGHEGGTIYAAGTPEYQTVLQWIQQGARP